MNNRTRIAVLIALGIILVGCKSDDRSALAWDDPFFPRDDVTPPTKVIQDQQAANGAAADAMLFDIHFDGSELNSLGEHKLALMAKGRSARMPMKVFLNMPQDADTSPQRQAAVEKTLETLGVVREQFSVAFGPNPAVLMPADAGIRALSPAGAAAAPANADQSAAGQ